MSPSHRDAMTLLDETDVVKRLLQHVAILVAILLLASAAAVIDDGLDASAALMAGGLALFGVAALIDQRWEVSYKGHRITVVNNPFRGEKLFVDDVRVARGRLGFRSEMRTTIPSGSGGDSILVIGDAGFTRYRCRILAEPGGAGGRLSDEQLLSEIQRRGLGART